MNLINEEQLTAMTAGVPELLLEILEDFSNDASSKIAALKGQDHQSAAPTLHQLKGSSGTLGLNGFHLKCAELELATKGKEDLAESWIEDLEKLLAESVQQARDFLKS